MTKNNDCIDEMMLARSAIRSACAIDYEYIGGHVERKERDWEYGTKKAVEEDVVRYLKAIYPNDNFVILPNENVSLGKRTWTIETTKERENGNALASVQCSLFENASCVMSAIYLAFCDRMFTVTDGGRVFLDGRLTEVCSNIYKEDISLSVRYADSDSDKETGLAHDTLIRLMKKCSAISVAKSSCTDFTDLVTGKTDGLIFIGDEDLTFLSGWLLCKEAGCVSMRIKVSGISVAVLSSDRRIFDMLVDVLNITG